MSLIRSLFNAVNSQQYDRAYSYWASTPGTPGGPPTYAAFKQGYADTKSVALVTGSVTTGAAAGTIYYAVPAVLQVHLTNGGQRTYYGCYTSGSRSPRIRLSRPSNRWGSTRGPSTSRTAALTRMRSYRTPASREGGRHPSLVSGSRPIYLKEGYCRHETSLILSG